MNLVSWTGSVAQGIYLVRVTATKAAGGCGGSSSTTPSQQPPGNTADVLAPVISSVSLNPPTLSFYGGLVRVSTRSTDESGVSGVWMVVTGPTGAPQSVDLAQAASGSSIYTAQYPLPANTAATGVPLGCTFRIYARDGVGNVGSTNPIGVTGPARSPTAPAPSGYCRAPQAGCPSRE